MLEGNNCRKGKNLKVLGKGQIILKDNVTIGENVTINVSERLIIGDRTIIGNDFLIEGREIQIGTEFWSGHHCQIGGGSCFEKTSNLRIGYWCHLGNYGFINTARLVHIGNEVGMGTGTKIYTHGAYLSFLDGFPVEFGPITIQDNVWLPGAVVLPNVTIGKNVVIGVGSVVNSDIPSGCLAAGVPAKVLRQKCYPKKHTSKEKMKLIVDFLAHFRKNIVGSKVDIEYKEDSDILYLFHSRNNATEFHISEKTIHGEADLLTEMLRNELRRYGVRFKSYPENRKYVHW
jgi:acetyltransferase-like isoleucine patch superfamily enzyme